MVARRMDIVFSLVPVRSRCCKHAVSPGLVLVVVRCCREAPLSGPMPLCVSGVWGWAEAFLVGGRKPSLPSLALCDRYASVINFPTRAVFQTAEKKKGSGAMADMDLPMTQEPIKVYENTYLMKPTDAQR